MSVPRRQPRPSLLGSPARIWRFARLEVVKLFAHRFFPFTLVAVVIVVVGLGLAGMHFAEQATSQDSKFWNYGLWVVTSIFGLTVGTVLLMVLSAMSVSSEASARTLNTMLTRPVRRVEFLCGKLLALFVAAVLVVLVTGVSGYLMGGTVPPRVFPVRKVVLPDGTTRTEVVRPGFPTYCDVVAERYPTSVIAPYARVMGRILLGFALMLAPILAAMSVGFLLGVLLDSTAVAVGLTVGLHAFLIVINFLMILGKTFADVVAFVERYSYSEATNQITAIMVAARGGSPPAWDDVVHGLVVCAAYVVVCLALSFLVFCRRDVTL